MKKLSQQQIIFCILYKQFKEDNQVYIPAWRFIGEVYIPELNRHEFMSYKTPARLSDLNNNNPSLLETIEITGKSGSKYIAYRINQNVDPSFVVDPKIKELHRELSNYYKTVLAKNLI